MKNVIIIVISLFMIVSTSVKAESVSGQIGVSLTIVPNHGCSQQYCAVDQQKLLAEIKNGKVKHDFKVTQKENLVTVEF